jgi:hypothetical protein
MTLRKNLTFAIRITARGTGGSPNFPTYTNQSQPDFYERNFDFDKNKYIKSIKNPYWLDFSPGT